MKPSLLFGLSCSVLITYACGKSDEDEKQDAPADGLGGGDGDFYVPEGDGDGGDGDGDGDDVELPPPYESCVLDGMETVGDPEERLLFDDFDDGDASLNGNGMTGTWYDYDDGTATHSPAWGDSGGWLPEPGGLTEDGYALHAVGTGFTTWGSGQGATPAWNDAQQTNCLYDASAYDGVSFWLRGSVVVEESLAVAMDRGVIKFGVAEPDIVPVEEGGNCTGDTGECWDWHKMRVTPGECWQRISVRFDDLAQDGWGAPDDELEMAEMLNFNFEVAQGHSYDFWIDEVMFFVGDTPEPEERCDLGMGGAGGGGAGGGGN